MLFKTQLTYSNVLHQLLQAKPRLVFLANSTVTQDTDPKMESDWI
jgi:hypothetical protein